MLRAPPARNGGPPDLLVIVTYRDTCGRAAATLGGSTKASALTLPQRPPTFLPSLPDPLTADVISGKQGFLHRGKQSRGAYLGEVSVCAVDLSMWDLRWCRYVGAVLW